MDARNLFKIEKLKRERINDKYAKYNSVGQLYCDICKLQIKNEFQWSQHLLDSRHIELVGDAFEDNRKRQKTEVEQGEQDITAESLLPSDFFDAPITEKVKDDVSQELKEFEEELAKEDEIQKVSSLKDDDDEDDEKIEPLNEEQLRHRWNALDELEQKNRFKKLEKLKKQFKSQNNNIQNSIKQAESDDEDDDDEDFEFDWRRKKK